MNTSSSSTVREAHIARRLSSAALVLGVWLVLAAGAAFAQIGPNDPSVETLVGERDLGGATCFREPVGHHRASELDALRPHRGHRLSRRRSGNAGRRVRRSSTPSPICGARVSRAERPTDADRGPASQKPVPCRHGAQTVVVDPPAASIFSLAAPENLWTVTSTLTSMSPVPSTLTGRPSRTAPLATRSSTVTSPPFG